MNSLNKFESFARRLALPTAAATALLVGLPATASATQTVDVAVSQITGTAPFDSGSGFGEDSSPTDEIVRSNDTISYLVQLNVNDSNAGASTASNVTVTQTLPAGMKWTRLPATCLPSPGVPSSSISPDGLTIVCNIGTVPTGQATTVTLSANVTEMANGAPLTPAADSVSVVADGTNTATTTPAEVIVSSVPRVDMVKAAPKVTTTTYNGEEGYFLDYPVRIEIPNFGGRGLIGYEPPAAAMNLDENFSKVSPNAEFVSCGPDVKGTWTCPSAGASSPVPIDIVINDPNSIASGTLTSTTVRLFVPKSDVVAADNVLVTDNQIESLHATDVQGNPAVGEIPTNNNAKVTLSLYPGYGFNIYKHYIDVTAPGRYIPGGPNLDRNGHAAVGAGQIFQAEVRTNATNAAAGFDSVSACDVIDSTSQKLTLLGPAASSTYGKGKPVWITANSVVNDLPYEQGTDFVIEYSSDPTDATAADASRWTALKSTGCTSGTWTSTPPANEAEANAVKRVRVRFLVTPARQYTLAFAVNLAAKPNTDGAIVANFATYDSGTGWVASTYDPETMKGSRGDRLLFTAAQVKLAKDIVSPVTPPTGSPNVRPGEEVEFALRPTVFVPSQSVAPTVVTARSVQVTDILPAGIKLSTSAGHGVSPKPASVTLNKDGTTTIVWNLGTLTSNDTPRLTYWVTIAPTASGAKVNRSMVTSPDDVGSPTTVPTSGTDPHFAARTLTVDSLGGIQVDKEVLTPHAEPHDQITYTVTYANLDQIDRDGMDVIDVLPFNGDGAAAGVVPGRNVPSKFHGSVKLASVTGTDVDQVFYTDAAPAAVYALYDPSASATGFDALPAGKNWCTAAQITAAGAGCPKSIASSTAVRIRRLEALGANETATFSFVLDTPGSRSGDVYSNTSALRSSSLDLGTLSLTRTARVHASSIGDFVWNDSNRNGRQDRGERGIAGVKVTLEGTDKHGSKVKVVTRTDAKGKYLFTSGTQAGHGAGARDLVSGSYRVTFDRSSLPARSSFTRRYAAGSGIDSDADPTTGKSGLVKLPNPAPLHHDGSDLTIDAGIVIQAAPSKRPPPFTG